jgi:uncharacterized membrane protein YidH (DUF202 family)
MTLIAIIAAALAPICLVIALNYRLSEHLKDTGAVPRKRDAWDRAFVGLALLFLAIAFVTAAYAEFKSATRSDDRTMYDQRATNPTLLSSDILIVSCQPEGSDGTRTEDSISWATYDCDTRGGVACSAGGLPS